jgi:hypothetical protein
MKRVAAPMVGGIVTSFILELLVYPAIYAVWRERSLPPEPGDALKTERFLQNVAAPNGLVPASLERS